jgi:hypothetical protein
MSVALAAAALLLVVVGAAHSVLGERYILVRLFRRTDLPRLFGSDRFTRRTLRFAWHLTTVAWWGCAALLAALALDPRDPRGVALAVLAATFAVTGAVIAAASRGRHLAWPLFLAVALLAWLAR